MSKILWFFSIILFCNSIVAHPSSDAITGIYYTKDQKGKIEIYANNGRYDGKVIWLKTAKNPDGTYIKDIHNPDKSLRNRNVVGIVLLKNFKFDNNIWDDGDIYDPESGNSYSGQIKIKDKNTIEVRGYMGFSLLGRSETWTRVQ